MNRIEPTPILGYQVFSGNLNETRTSGKIIINTINPHSYCVARKDELFQNALKTSDFLLPDGIGIVLAARFLRGKRIQKIAGADLHEFLIKTANTQKLKVFYLGASEATLEKIKTRLNSEYSDISVETYSPPYKPVFSAEDNSEMITRVNAFAPDYLFVGMTAPKQEKWSFEHKDALNAKIICSIGAVFDFYAGTVKRPHRFWIKLGLEWFIRFAKEPRRLSERNLVSMPKFLWYVFIAKFTGK
jgi:N-acetylglucosaminyldiphosphoundecaprenol N-acetyl-beta-D-mannosaminyltransferase